MDEQPFRKINTLRKAGKLQDAWDFGCPAVQENPNDTYLKQAFFWVCFDYLKQVQAPIKERAQQNNGNFNPNSNELERINFLLDWVIWLNIPPGGIEHRNLFLVFQKNLECIPKLVLFLVQFGSSLFEDKDKIPYQGEKGESPSLILKFARKVAKAWMQNEEVRQIKIDQLLMLLDQARNEGQDIKNMIWLDYDEAKCLIMAGRLEQARQFILPVLRKKQTESWAWGALAATYREENTDTAIVLFCKGLSHARDEKFSLPLLKGLAPLLAGSGHAAEASMCVRRAVNCYEDNGWKIKANLENLASQSWFDNEVNPSDLAGFVESKSQSAMDLLHGPSEQCVAIVSNIHQSGKGFEAYRDEKHSYAVRLGLYKAKAPPKAGTYIRLTLSAEDSSVISAVPCDAVAMRDVGFEHGEIKVTGKGFGFVNGVFVAPHLIEAKIDGQLVSIIKIMGFNKSKNKTSWEAITLQLAKDSI
jgi:tetratricopeptide (TPR) repeat protein